MTPPSPDGPPSRLDLEGIVVDAGGRRVLDHVDLAVHRGITVVLGPSGSGKSTLLRLMNRLDAPSVGTVRLDGVDVAELDPPELRRRVAMVFQRPLIFEGDVLSNLGVAHPRLDRAHAAAVLARVGLDADLLGQDARTLSGGEGQRLALARALLNDPEVVLADEVTSMLDREAADAIGDLLVELARSGTDVVMVSHDGAAACRRADRIVVLVDGTVRADGTPDELTASIDPAVRRAIGGAP